MRTVWPKLLALSFASLIALLLANSIPAVDASHRRRGGGAARRALKQHRARHGSHHYSLIDPTRYASLLGDDYGWAVNSIPLLDIDSTTIEQAYYFRWRVFKKHLKRVSASGSSSSGSSVQCCLPAGSLAPCTVVSAATGWCSGSHTEIACHHTRTAGKPCVWSGGRCTKGSACPAQGAAPTSTAASGFEGWVVTEFEPDVPWAGVHNTIACSAGHHIMEGRWLRNRTYLDDTTRFWIDPASGAQPSKYTFWASSSYSNRELVTGDRRLMDELYPRLVALYDEMVRTHYAEAHACFWSYADRDGQELSIGGDGCRPLLNAALYGEARALAAVAERLSDAKGAARFQSEARRWQRSLLSLWDPTLQFFMTRAAERPTAVALNPWSEQQVRATRALNGGRCPPAWPSGQLVRSRELQGLSSPWYFGAVPPEHAPKYAQAWARAFATDGFAGRWGPRTAERQDACFNFSSGHECAWNGPSWPFETSKLITGALNMLHDYPSETGGIDADGLWALLFQYARAHTESTAVNASAWLLTGHAWIGEALHPDDGVWIVREALYRAGSAARNRGHRYLHSTFCDLVIGVLGLRPRADRTLVVRPLVPKRLGIRYFALDGLRIQGHDVSVAYDRDGTRYGLDSRPGRLHVLVDGVVAASGHLGDQLVVRLP